MLCRIFQFVLLTLSAAIFAGTATAQPDFSGEYVMQGKGFGSNDRAYAGTCSLQREEQGYKVSCFNQDTRHTYAGKGLAIGDTLAIFIGDLLQGDHNATYAGEYLIVYQRDANRNLAGKWLHTTSPAAGMEILTRGK